MTDDGRAADLRAAIDLGIARSEFILAVCRQPKVWDDLIETLTPPVNERLVEVANFVRAMDEWPAKWNIDAEWVRRWLLLAWAYLRSGFIRSPEGLLSVAVPQPNPEYVLSSAITDGCSVFWWNTDDPDEWPPNPGFEHREQFDARMDRSWKRRVASLKLSEPAKKKIARDAAWFARFQVGCEDYAEIWSTAREADRRTVERAITDFARLIGITKRTESRRN